MKCPKCGSNNLKVIDTISSLDDEIYRCRKCSDCDNRFYTVEFEVETNDKVIDIFKHAHNVKNVTRYRKMVAASKKNNI